MKVSSTETIDEFAALIGIDWADKKHDICEFNVANHQVQHSVIAHTPESIDEWAVDLKRRYNDKKIAVACELKKGPLINALQVYEHLVIFPLNPSMVAKYRQAFANSGSKSDPVDAQIQLEILQVHRHKLRPLTAPSPIVRQLSQLVEYRRRLVQDRVNLSNKITNILKLYYPPST